MGFYVQDDYWKAVEEQPRKVQQEVLWAISYLYFTGEEPDCLKGVSKSLFISMRGRVYAARENKERKASKRSGQTEGQIADKSRTNDGTNRGQIEDTSIYKSERESESKRENYDPYEPDTKKDCESTKPKRGSGGFQPPTPSQVEEYASDYKKSKGWKTPFDAENFCDFYASKNWLVGKAKMSDWKAAVRRWIREDHDKNPRGDKDNGSLLSPEYRHHPSQAHA